jgi:hypothetical protein
LRLDVAHREPRLCLRFGRVGSVQTNPVFASGPPVPVAVEGFIASRNHERDPELVRGTEGAGADQIEWPPITNRESLEPPARSDQPAPTGPQARWRWRSAQQASALRAEAREPIRVSCKRARQQFECDVRDSASCRARDRPRASRRPRPFRGLGDLARDRERLLEQQRTGRNAIGKRWALDDLQHQRAPTNMRPTGSDGCRIAAFGSDFGTIGRLSVTRMPGTGADHRAVTQTGRNARNRRGLSTSIRGRVSCGMPAPSIAVVRKLTTRPGKAVRDSEPAADRESPVAGYFARCRRYFKINSRAYLVPMTSRYLPRSWYPCI